MSLVPSKFSHSLRQHPQSWFIVSLILGAAVSLAGIVALTNMPFLVIHWVLFVGFFALLIIAVVRRVP